jgi:hypothetical protein
MPCVSATTNETMQIDFDMRVLASGGADILVCPEKQPALGRQECLPHQLLRLLSKAIN